VSNRLRSLREISIEEVFHSILSSEDPVGDRGMLVGNVPIR